MRFIPNGPDIPEELLVARDRGEVIFFCGAGVSRARANLPDFFGLGEQVIQLLGSGRNSAARRLFDKAATIEAVAGVGSLVAADRIFGLLEREFEVRDVREAVSQAIRPAADVDISAHQILLDLATPRNGATRLVTTNFDLLFEQCRPDLECSGPPHLPDPKSDRDFRGIIHLHGRVNEAYSGPADDEFVVSSADFGRAYLSDGWATRFIQSLLQRYYIVFVGYTADDPPVQYLLEALNLNAGTASKLFAFQQGEFGEASALWEHKGVRAIPFGNAGFSPLWDTLQSWAARARDVDTWYRELFEKAAVGPVEAGPHVRGQIAALVTTDEGAKRFADAAPALDGRWLLALDPKQRYADSARLRTMGVADRFDPFDSLGLDSDPPPSPEDLRDQFRSRSVPANALDPLSANSQDDVRAPFGPFRGEIAPSAPLNRRLWNLVRWLQSVAHEPVAVWWAAHQNGIHPALRQAVSWTMRQHPTRFTPSVQRGWRQLLSAWDDHRQDPNHVKYEIEGRAQREGWSFSVVREIASAHSPRLVVDIGFGGSHPLIWETTPDPIVRPDIHYPRFHSPTLVPDPWIGSAVSEFRRNLDLAAAMERDVKGHGTLYIRTTRADDGEREHISSSTDLTGLLFYYFDLLHQLARFDSGAALDEIAKWSKTDDQISARVRIWAAGKRDLTNGPRAADLLASLSDDAFWAGQHNRDLLFALRDRWADLPDEAKRSIEARTLNAPLPWLGDPGDAREALEAHERLNRLQWLTGQGVTFSFDLEAEMARLRALAPDWEERYGRGAAETNVMRFVSIATDTDPAPLAELPISQILTGAQTAEHIDFDARVRREPFQGLAKRRPARALKALSQATKKGVVPSRQWADFLYSDARKSDSTRLQWVLGHRLTRLPLESLITILHPVTAWMEDARDFLHGRGADIATALWAGVVAATIERDGAGPRPFQKSWAEAAVDAPVGRLVAFALGDPKVTTLKAGDKLPLVLANRFKELLSLPGHLGPVALVMIAFHLVWLDEIDPVWTRQYLVPASSDMSDDGDAFWEGVLWRAHLPRGELYMLLKPGLLARADRYEGQSHYGSNYAGFILAGWGGELDRPEPGRLISDEDFRELILGTTEEVRSAILFNLRQWSGHEAAPWHGRLLTFFEAVWPRQRAIRTSRMSYNLVELIMESGSLFPDLVRLVGPGLAPLKGGGIYGIALQKDEPDHPARIYPCAMLDLLWFTLTDDASEWPFDIGEILTILGEAPELQGDGRLSELRLRQTR